MRMLFPLIVLLISNLCFGQINQRLSKKNWVDSVYESLSNDEKIGQLIVARLSILDPQSKKVRFLITDVENFVAQYNIGGVCIFQGNIHTQAQYINRLKKLAKTPILFSIDGEWGVAMRLYDSVLPLPRQMMLGATSDESLIETYGAIVAKQCKRFGIQMNYAPVIDINNNPKNPVINDRSFGEDKEKVSRYGNAYIRGLQKSGVLACVKHFPGHGDVDVDSHLDLPVINKSLAALDTLELYPFKKAIEMGVGSAMIAHLSIPSIDSRSHRPTSLSKKNIDSLLRSKLGFEGLCITDGLEMKGVKKYFPDGEAEVEAIIAGNDLLCLPDSIPLVVNKITKAINRGDLSWADIEVHVKRVLNAKYDFVLPNTDTIQLDNLLYELNQEVIPMRKRIAEKAITLIRQSDRKYFPLTRNDSENIAYLGFGLNKENSFSRSLKTEVNADVFLLALNQKNKDSLQKLMDTLRTYQSLIIGIHQLNRAPANQFGMSNEGLNFIRMLQDSTEHMTFLFGNAYAASYLQDARNLAICYEDDSVIQQTALQLLLGKLDYQGVLPVSINNKYPYGFGLKTYMSELTLERNAEIKMDRSVIAIMENEIKQAIDKKAMPGCSILVVQDGKILFDKTYGFETYSKSAPLKKGALYDLASVTKILSTTFAIMKLTEEGKINLSDRIGKYLPELKDNKKSTVSIQQLLMHEGGLTPYIPFYKSTMDEQGNLSPAYYSSTYSETFPIPVAQNLYFSKKGLEEFWGNYLESAEGAKNTYLYSDLDFILLGKLIEQVSGEPLHVYLEKNYYRPMGLNRLCYLPLEKFEKNDIIPSCYDQQFRKQELRGWVHDQGAALMGGVAGHAGLFGDVYDAAALMQCLIQEGCWKGVEMLSPSTIKKFTAYQHEKSRRGLGFDKPELKKNDAEPYPGKYVGAGVFGHLGYTGTSVWADPEKKRIVVFLSNRVYEENNVFQKLRLRSFVLDRVYEALDGKNLN